MDWRALRSRILAPRHYAVVHSLRFTRANFQSYLQINLRSLPPFDCKIRCLYFLGHEPGRLLGYLTYINSYILPCEGLNLPSSHASVPSRQRASPGCHCSCSPLVRAFSYFVNHSCFQGDDDPEGNLHPGGKSNLLNSGSQSFEHQHLYECRHSVRANQLVSYLGQRKEAAPTLSQG